MIRKMPCASRLPNSCWMLRSLEDLEVVWDGKDFLLGKFPMFFLKIRFFVVSNLFMSLQYTVYIVEIVV